MAKFGSYAKRLNEAAKEAFENYKKAEEVCKLAEDRRRNMPWNATPEEKTIAEARLIEARNDLKKAQAAMTSGLDAMKGIRGELANALGSYYRANPEDVDPNTMELLRSGILTPSEYASLANQAINAGNNTMLRVVGSFAEKLANKLQYQKDASKERQALYSVSVMAKRSTGAAEMDTFDSLVDTFARCTQNPALIDRWDELTQDAINAF